MCCKPKFNIFSLTNRNISFLRNLCASGCRDNSGSSIKYFVERFELIRVKRIRSSRNPELSPNKSYLGIEIDS